MNTVYIYNANRDKGFSSLLMNDLNVRGISFNNLQTTKIVNPNNILIYIPKVGTGNKYYSDIVSDLGTVEHDIANFRMRIITLVNHIDYKSIRTVFDNYFGKHGFKYYQAIGFDTLLSRIVANECTRVLRRK